MKITIVYMTGRKDPHLEWAVEGIEEQAKSGDEIELVIIDALHRNQYELMDYVSDITSPAIQRIVVSPPKPNIWQGKDRITKEDWWATANARNTAICLAKTDYLVFLDDRCWLGDQWLKVVREGERRRDSVIVGSYDKLEDGKVTSDHRRGLKPNGMINCGGGWLYGCTFALPLEWCLEVNGLEEGCDGLTGEDYIFGLMLGNNGRRIDFLPEMFVKQDRSMGTEHGFKMTDKGVSPKDKSHAALDRFGKARRSEFTPNLREIRKAGVFPNVDKEYEYRDWYDGQLIREF